MNASLQALLAFFTGWSEIHAHLVSGSAKMEKEIRPFFYQNPINYLKGEKEDLFYPHLRAKYMKNIRQKMQLVSLISHFHACFAVYLSSSWFYPG